MNNREQRIRERAFSLWQADGGIHGRHEDHWRQAEREIGESDPETVPNKSDTASSKLTPEAPQAGTEQQDVPPARLGQSERRETPVESGGQSNPVHHEGRLPADPLSK